MLKIGPLRLWPSWWCERRHRHTLVCEFQGRARVACTNVEIAPVSDVGAGLCVARVFRHRNTIVRLKVEAPMCGM